MTEPVPAQARVEESLSLENIFVPNRSGVDSKTLYLAPLNSTEKVDETVKKIGSYLSEIAAAAICTYKPGASFDLSLPKQILMQIDDLMEHYKSNENFKNNFLPEFSKHQQNFRALHQLMSEPSKPVFSDTEQIPEVLQEAAVRAEGYLNRDISSVDDEIQQLNVQLPQTSAGGGANNQKIASLNEIRKTLTEAREFTGLLKAKPEVVVREDDVLNDMVGQQVSAVSPSDVHKNIHHLEKLLEDSESTMSVPEELHRQLDETKRVIGLFPSKNTNK